MVLHCKWLLFSLLLIVSGETSSGGTHGSSELDQLQQSAQEQSVKDKQCIEFDDGCIICSRRGDEIICSTPRIACIKKRNAVCVLKRKNDD